MIKAMRLAEWLVSEGRLLGDEAAIVKGFGERLVAAGVPLWRVRVEQRFVNPLLSAWGVIWWRDEAATKSYVVPIWELDTSSWIGSPFAFVVEHRATFRRRLQDLDPTDDHAILRELAKAGATDFFSMPLEYGDGSVQGMSLASDGAQGFGEEHIALFEDLRHPLAAAMEPVAMRRSTASLLKTYLGSGPSEAVVAGAIRRGDLSSLDALVMFSDLRDFTEKSATWGEEALLDALDHYFELIVNAVQDHKGDVLKFLGDGVLAVFPITREASASQRCTDALSAALDSRRTLSQLNSARKAAEQEPLDFGTALHMGQVTYGNIGSPDRLDFTVIGETVNIASRVQHLCKALGEPILCTAPTTNHIGDALKPLGSHRIRGLANPIELFAPTHQDSAE